MSCATPILLSGPLGHVPETAGHVAEIAGHDPETVGHLHPKYAVSKTTGDLMFTLIAKVAYSGELMEVMETKVSLVEGKRMIGAALADDRALPNHGPDMKDGEV